MVQVPTTEEMVTFAQSQAKVAMHYFGLSEEEAGHELKPDETIVTKADLEINANAIDWIKKYYSGVSVFGEEQSYDSGGDYDFVIDPIDGTLGFAEGEEDFTILSALKKGATVIRSVILEPVTGTYYTAEAGKGFSMHGQATVRKTENIIACIGWHGCGVDMKAVTRRLQILGYKIVEPSSIGYADAKVACGQWAGVIFPQQKDGAWHDTIQGDLMVREAGGITSDLAGKPLEQTYQTGNMNGHIMSCDVEVHDVLLNVVAKYGDI